MATPQVDADQEPTFSPSFYDQTNRSSYRYTKKTGFLTKSPTRGRSSKIGRWQRRWCVLVESIVSRPGITPERYIWLEYFKVPAGKSSKPVLKGMLDLRSCIAVVASDKPMKGNEYVFNVISKDKVHYFAAESEEERQDWITALNECLFPKKPDLRLQHSTEQVAEMRTRLPSAYLDCITNSGVHQKSSTTPRPSRTSREEPAGENHQSKGTQARKKSNDDSSIPSRLNYRLNIPQDKWMPTGMGCIEKPKETENTLHVQLAGFGVSNIPRQQVIIGDPVLSQGSFLCYKGKWVSSGEQNVFVKAAREHTGITNLLQEAAILAQLYHPNVMRLYGVISVGHPKMTIMELCARGNLKNRLQSLKKEAGGFKTMDYINIGEKISITLLNYCRQITLGMHYLSERGFIHKSLCAKHILVTEDDNCKISGFSSSIGGTRSFAQDRCPLSRWLPPEVLITGNYTVASTIWSIGTVMYKIWCLGDGPSTGSIPSTRPKVIQKIDAGYRLPQPQGCPKSIYDSIIYCWQKHPENRPSYNYITDYLLRHESVLLGFGWSKPRSNSAADERNLSMQDSNSKESIVKRKCATLQSPVTQHPFLDYLSPRRLSKSASYGGISSKDGGTPKYNHSKSHDESDLSHKSLSASGLGYGRDDSDDEDYKSDVSTLLEIRRKNSTGTSLATLPSTTDSPMFEGWTHFYSDGGIESSQESECESPVYQNAFHSLPILSVTGFSSAAAETRQQYAWQHSKDHSPHVDSPIATTSYHQNGIMNEYEINNMLTNQVPTIPDDKKQPSNVEEKLQTNGAMPSSHKWRKETEKEPFSAESTSASIPAEVNERKKRPVAAPRKRPTDLKHHVDPSTVQYYNYNPQIHQKVHSSIKLTVTPERNKSSSSSSDEYEAITTYDPEILKLLEADTTQQSERSSRPLSHHSADEYEYLQRYELVTNILSIEDVLTQEQQHQQQNPQRFSRTLSY